MQEKSTRTPRIFWLISAPRESTNYELIKNKAKQHVKDDIKVFDIPEDMKVGTLDSLYGLLDDLAKVDQFVETTTKKIAKQMYDLFGEQKEKGEQNKDGDNILVVANVNIDTYMLNFEWNHAKFKSSSPLKELVDAIASELSSMDEELRTMQSEYSGVVHSIDSFKREKEGNLQVRDLTDVITKEHFVESIHLTTLFVVVAKHYRRDFLEAYENLCLNIVPRSALEVVIEGDQILYRVVVFKTSKEEFKAAASLRKWAVRDIRYDETKVADKQEQQEENVAKRDKIRADLIRWCRSNFAEAFVNWVHLKAIKMFVESILRFGLPRDFVCLVMEINAKREKALRKFFDDIYKHLGSEFLSGSIGNDVVVPGASNETLYAYVFTEISL